MTEPPFMIRTPEAIWDSEAWNYGDDPLLCDHDRLRDGVQCVACNQIMQHDRYGGDNWPLESRGGDYEPDYEAATVAWRIIALVALTAATSLMVLGVVFAFRLAGL